MIWRYLCIYLALFRGKILSQNTTNTIPNQAQVSERELDVIAFLDYPLYQIWLKAFPFREKYISWYIKTYYNDIFASVQNMFNKLNLQPPLRIKLHPMKICTKPACTMFSIDNSRKNITSDTTTMKTANEKGNSSLRKSEDSGCKTLTDEDMKKYQNQFISQHRDTLIAFDHIVVFTHNKADLGNTTGVSLKSSVCTQLSITILKDNRDWMADPVVAILLAKSLGYDGVNEPNCSISKDWLEKPLTLQTEYFDFPTCAMSFIQEYLKSLDIQDIDHCLTWSLGDIDDVRYEKKEPARQCVALFGYYSYPCLTGKGLKFATVCRNISCFNPETEACVTVRTAPGTCCGRGSHCEDGVCSKHWMARECRTDKNCPYGNIYGKVPGINKTCSQVKAKDCYHKLVSYRCCSTCVAFTTGIPHCQYGDKQTGCNIEDCGSGNQGHPDCCGTCCEAAELKQSKHKVNCSREIIKHQRRICYNKNFRSLCCNTCKNFYTKGCPYGNRAGRKCDKLLEQDFCSKPEKSECCATCEQIENKFLNNLTLETPFTIRIGLQPTTTPNDIFQRQIDIARLREKSRQESLDENEDMIVLIGSVFAAALIILPAACLLLFWCITEKVKASMNEGNYELPILIPLSVLEHGKEQRNSRKGSGMMKWSDVNYTRHGSTAV